jgi:hypothetical protein
MPTTALSSKILGIAIYHADPRMTIQHSDTLRNILRTNSVIAVQWENIGSACRLDAGVPSSAQSSIRLVDDRVAFTLKTAQNIERKGVCRTVVDDQNLIGTPIRVPFGALNGLWQILAIVEARDYN